MAGCLPRSGVGGWLCLGFLWFEISEDDVIFRVDASLIVDPSGFASYGLFTAGFVLVVGVVHLRRV